MVRTWYMGDVRVEILGAPRYGNVHHLLSNLEGSSHQTGSPGRTRRIASPRLSLLRRRRGA